MTDLVLASSSGGSFSNCTLGPSLTLTGTSGTFKVTQAVGAMKATAVIADGSLGTLPIGAVVRSIQIQNTTANAVTGGLRIGKTAGAADVVAATAVGANALVTINGAAILIPWFSQASTQQLFISTVVAWNSANVTVWVLYDTLA